MIGKKMEGEIGTQINRELYSAYLYLSMSNYAHEQNFEGIANWLRKQAKEELDHGMKLYDYLIEHGNTVTLSAIEQPPSSWSSIQEVFERVLEHEQKVTGYIHDLMRTAMAEQDFATQIMLQWYITEQVEEEGAARQIVEKLKFVGETRGGIMMTDYQLGKRA